jgi:Uma2 family endonuclease
MRNSTKPNERDAIASKQQPEGSFPCMPCRDDGIVFVMEKKITVDEYFRYPESNRPMELVYGYVREPAMPSFRHETILIRIAALLDSHVRERKTGKVGRADVVLDREEALVVQPDLFFISNERMGIVDDRVWGAPDLVIEIASPSTQHRDRTLKVEWFRRYGVRECWLVYPKDQRVEVVDCEQDTRETFTGTAPIRSKVLPDFAAPVNEFFV